MGTILIHAGMPKTGSTSVQSWLTKHAQRLREAHGVYILVATSRTPRNPTDDVRLEPYESGRVNSGLFITEWNRAGRPPAAARRFIDDLATFAEQYPTVLVTAEALSEPFWRADETFLDGFERLAGAHDVRVAYYVRPQHSAIESGWREGGYKLGKEPARYVREFSTRLHYLRTLDDVGKLAPNLGFQMRPFRTDLLDGENPVQDFVRTFLSLNENCSDVYANPGLPLQLVNVLRDAPEGWFWSGENHSEIYPRRELRKVFDGLEISESPTIRRSRLVLQQHCHEVFESENLELIRRRNWATESYVPPAEGLEGAWDVGELDRLWVADASKAERDLLYRALRAALGNRND